jgi:endonuclease/exonuclease/phosphatase family metal-dependent hydrolase
MRVLTWNLFHGRSVPDTPRSLLEEFGSALAAWEWDVALLQEVPPWWPGPLARACGGDAEARAVMTSRNFGLSARRWVAERRPDVIKSNGGGANAILVRGLAVGRHASAQVRRVPERRWVHGVALDGGALWVGNVHASTAPPRAREDMARAGAALLEWAGGAPALLGGDANVADPAADGLVDLGGHRIDRFLARGLAATAPVEVLDAGALSDHAPVRIAVS